MKMCVDCYDRMIDIEILSPKELLKTHVRYVGSDFNAGVDIYEDQQTWELVGCKIPLKEGTHETKRVHRGRGIDQGD